MLLDYPMLPKYGNRRSLVYLMWAGMAVACVHFIVAVATLAMRKKFLPEAQKMKQQQQKQQQGLEAVELYGAPLPRYRTNAPDGYMPLPPSPPAGGYPSSVPPPPPAGGYSSTAPGYGGAPLLGVHVNSTAVLQGNGGTAQQVLPQQQPTV